MANRDFLGKFKIGHEKIGNCGAPKGIHNSKKTEFKKGISYSYATQFKKGLIPWNKGRKGLQIAWNKGKRGYKVERVKNVAKIKICQICNIFFSKKTKYCSQKCAIKSNMGENNYRWIKDRTKVIGRHDRELHDPEYKQWRRGVCNRDNWKCKINNSDCKGRLEVHHILGWKNHPELRYEVNNGITLCHFHHPRKRKDEMRLSPYFQELIKV